MKKKIAVITLPFAVILLFILLSFLYLKITDKYPIACFFYLFTGKYCPGCGMTRSVTAFLHGDILLSIRNNPAFIAILIFSSLKYAELFSKCFFKDIKIFPVNRIFWIVFTGTALVFYILRNFIPFLAPV